jgi:hypothetical protein
MVSNQSRFGVGYFAVRGMAFAMALILASVALPVRAQGNIVQAEPTDLSGSWVSPLTENAQERDAGPLPGNWTGMPLNAAGLARAESYAAGMLAEPERVCQLYGQWHYIDGIFNLRISPVVGGTGDAIQAWKIQKIEDVGGMIIWMNGEPKPSDNAHYPREAFSTGHWKGNELIAETTHLKSSVLRRNGAFYSDQSTLTSTYILHDNNVLTVVFIMQDPVYLTEPYVYTRTYDRSSDRPVSTAWAPCIVNYEGVDEGTVPFIPPGENSFVDQNVQNYHIPRYALEGGAQTMYPAFRDKLKAQYVSQYHTFSAKCQMYCHTRLLGPALPTAGPGGD